MTEALKYEDEHKPLDFVSLRDDLVARDAHSQIIPPELQDHFTDIQQEVIMYNSSSINNAFRDIDEDMQEAPF